MSHHLSERHANVKFIRHSQDPSREHAGEVTVFGIGRNEAIAKHVRQRMKVIGNRVNARQWFGQCGEHLEVDVDTRLSQTFDQRGLKGIGINARFNVHDPVQPAQFPKQTLDIDVLVSGQNVLKLGQGLQPCDGFWVNRFVDGWRPSCRPAKAFEPVPSIDDLQGHRAVSKSFDFDVALWMFLEVHEHERCELQPTHDDLDGSTCVSTAAPWILDIGHFRGVDAKGVGQQTMTQVNTGFNPIVFNAIIWSVEDVMCHHLEGGQMPARTSDSVDVRQANARL